MFVQLILTIGKARTFDKTLPPAFLGAFDFKKIAFVPYIKIQDIFYINDFNWKVTPSNHNTKEFQLIYQRIEDTLSEYTYVYNYQNDEKELINFIKNNIAKATTKNKIKIDKNNFVPIYLRWLEIVKPVIDVNWNELKEVNIFDNDFYLADLFVDDKNTQNIDDDFTIRQNLFVVFQNKGYIISKENLKQIFDAKIEIKNENAYIQFWKIYKRPPIKEFQDYIIERRDLLAPQYIREIKGAFFTPRIWVELSQKYLNDYLGKDWQDEYYIWDCAAGTGNLLAGLTNRYNIYASTLDQADVNVMHERIDHGANLLKNHVFQFDFLNDDFSRLPRGLQQIINDSEKRKKLVIYINPPYAEATSAKTVSGTGKNKSGVSTSFEINEYLKPKIGNASNEIFALFMANIYEKIPGCIIGQFSKLKFINGNNFRKFKEYFLADYINGFAVPAETFDNVKGKFPIGFTIWNTTKKSKIKEISTDVYDKNGNYSGEKKFYGNLSKSINKWIKKFDDKTIESIGFIENPTPDFQNNKFLNISSFEGKRHNNYLFLQLNNLINGVIYFSVRLCKKNTWLNDRDQYLHPNNGWKNDLDFQNNCLAYSLFHGQNRISSEYGINHWIPFTEYEVDAKEKFASNFMTDFINGKIKAERKEDLFSDKVTAHSKKEFSEEATAVFNAGRKLWCYYHSKDNVNVNASFYDIRAYFQGRNGNGRMNTTSKDENYTKLLDELRFKLNLLADVIKPKVYEYEFLKK